MQFYDVSRTLAKENWRAAPPLLHDLGDAATSLWMARLNAERDALSAVALKPRVLFPVLVECGGTIDRFDFPLHRGIYALFAECHTRGSLYCGRIAVKCAVASGFDADTVIDLFNRVSPTPANTVRHTARLIKLCDLLDEAQHHLANARALVASGMQLEVAA